MSSNPAAAPMVQGNPADIAAAIAQRAAANPAAQIRNPGPPGLPANAEPDYPMPSPTYAVMAVLPPGWHPNPPPPPAPGGAPPGPASGRVAVAFALAQLGKPYVFGATGPNSYDCSGLAVASYRAAGISLPHFTGDLIHYGRPVARGDLRAGDLVFPASDHMGVVLDSGRMVAAPHTGDVVKVQGIYAFYAGRRIVG